MPNYLLSSEDSFFSEKLGPPAKNKSLYKEGHPRYPEQLTVTVECETLLTDLLVQIP